ncbi:PREDICTED: G patch domain and ankyrin repeat-containing protein 1 homolog [Drosophila arizonae]|uniref:G patch domain and ankyrin repeat-containing protein 1 homolog n=1 Tax=Drosophila arizonae TaxID=7263 RepID=A0ABM1PG24_DROAR|nr:PREDICTED: G patch domain and ankyrin repeat-containing protein 1 homolog [Drosophila arizonae]
MNSSGQDLHPNWVALSTLNVPLKRFVHAGAVEQAKGKAERHRIDGVTGAEVQQFYKEILETPATAKIEVIKTSKCNATLPKKPARHPYDRNRFFRLAMANDVEQLSLMSISEERELNACDAFGWTALMMAACEGAEEAVVWLLEQGAAVDVRDKSGQTALELARKKGNRNIVELLENLDKSEVQAPHEMESTEAALSPFYCELCQREYTESTWRDHQTSTVHRFNMKSLPPHRLHKFNISVKNRGLQLMVGMGWDREHGLGPQQNGRLYPVKTVLRKQRTGLGIQQPPARVTHFEAFDTNATKRRHGNPAAQHKERRTRNEMKREKLRDWRRERRLRQELS